jgi:hypothetical protein
MALYRRFAHLSKLAFFLSLGIAATIVDACGGKDDDSGTDRDKPFGGGPSSGRAGSSGIGIGGSAQTPAGGTTTTEGGAGTGGDTGVVVDAGPPPRDAELWDVICE